MDFETQSLEYMAVGIGINVLGADFPPELQETVTSLEKELSVRVSRCRLAGELLNELELVFHDLQTKCFLEEYRSRSFLLGERINIISSAGTEPAVALNIDNSGGLIVRTNDGRIKTLHSGEVSVRKQ